MEYCFLCHVMWFWAFVETFISYWRKNQSQISSSWKVLYIRSSSIKGNSIWSIRSRFFLTSSRRYKWGLWATILITKPVFPSHLTGSITRTPSARSSSLCSFRISGSGSPGCRIMSALCNSQQSLNGCNSPHYSSSFWLQTFLALPQKPSSHCYCKCFSALLHQ